MKKRLIALLLCAALMVAPAFAAQTIAQWAVKDIVEAEALNLVDENTYDRLYETVTLDEIAYVQSVVSVKAGLLGRPLQKSSVYSAVIDSTRGGVLNALAMSIDGYNWDIDASGIALLQELGVVKGDGADLALERNCTVQEMQVFASRLILALYDRYDAGSKGLLWKATNGANGATLYLMGTYHVDLNNMYPMHQSVRNALNESGKVYFELDLLDDAGLEEYYAMQVYSDGERLQDNISAELYEAVLEVSNELGISEETVNTLKPWTLALYLSAMFNYDDTTGDSAMAVDTYLYTLAYVQYKEVGGVETYELQGNVFDSLSAEYQETLLIDAIYSYYYHTDPTVVGETETVTDNSLLIAWQSRDLKTFESLYNKDAMVALGDEYIDNLLTKRDPAMIDAAVAFLQEANSTNFLAVGAAHMIGTTGIVQGLINLGYTVELVA